MIKVAVIFILLLLVLIIPGVSAHYDPIGEEPAPPMGGPADDQFYCMAETIQNKVFWVPDWCLERALPQLPNPEGHIFMCKLGYMTTDPTEYMIAPTEAVTDPIFGDGWVPCEEVHDARQN